MFYTNNKNTNVKDEYKLMNNSIEIIEICLTIISICLSSIITILMYRISKRQTYFLEKTETNKRKPYLFPEEDKFSKQEWVRFHYGGKDLPAYIPKKEYNELTYEEQKFIEDCKVQNMKTYFTYLNNKLLLVLNLTTGMPNVIVEHYNSVIVLHNYGSIITKVHINWASIIYLNGTEKVMNDIEDNYYTGIIKDDIEIVLDEVVNDINDSSCDINEEIYENLVEHEAFKSNISISLKYKAYKINLSLYNQFNEKTDYLITIERVGNQFQRNVEEVESI